MVGESDVAGQRQHAVLVVADDVGADLRVALHDLPFVRIEWAGFLEHAVGDADLADVVHGRGVQQVVGLRFRHAGGQAQDAREMAHADHVQARLVVLVFGGQAEALDDFQARRAQFFHAHERQVRAHARAHDRRADGLGDVVDGARFEALDFVVAVVQRGDEDDGHGGQQRIGLQRGADFITAHAGHHHVEQDQVGAFLARQFERARAVLGKAQAVMVLQDLAQQLQVAGLVVHREDQRLIGGTHAIVSCAAASMAASTASSCCRARSKSKSEMAACTWATRPASG